jgi:bifunctional DNA-binding transcriptional regulator/antitoxin component of YhaV-PrlF toxin-antitoxin module
MPQIRMRPKRQVTLPVSIVREAGIQEDDKLNVTFIGGNIIITPQRIESRDDVMSYAGIFRGAWGETTEQVETTINGLRNEWDH